MKTQKLLVIPLMLVFLAVFVSAASVTTSLFYDSTTSDSLQIMNGQSAGVIISADSVLEPSMTITLNVLDSSGRLVANVLNTFTSFDSYSNYLFVGLSAYKAVGNYTIVSTVTAASGQTATDTLTLQVLPIIPPNTPPIITSTPVTQVNETQAYSYQVTATDADNDPLTYSLTQAPSWLSMDSLGLIYGIAPNVSSDYQYVATVNVSDGKSFVLQTFPITVKDTNQAGDTTPPLVTVISPQNNQVFTSSNVLLSIITDESSSTAWYSIDGSTNTSLIKNSPTSFSGTVSLTDGSHSVVFYAQDLAGNKGRSDTVSFAVNTTIPPSNNPPVISSAPVTQVSEGQVYNYQVIATDTDGDALTYSLAQAPTWLSVDPSTGLISGTAPIVSVDSSYPIVLQVSDGKDVVSQSYTLTVINIVPGNNLPVITSSPSTQVDENQLYTYQVTATDVDNDPLTYSLTQAPSWLSIDSTGLVSGTASSVSADTDFPITVTVSDGIGNTNQSYTLTVKDTSGSKPSGGIPRRTSNLSQVTNTDFEQQQYWAQFQPKTVTAEEGPAVKQKASSTLVWIIGIILLILILAIIVILIYRAIR